MPTAHDDRRIPGGSTAEALLLSMELPDSDGNWRVDSDRRGQPVARFEPHTREIETFNER